MKKDGFKSTSKANGLLGRAVKRASRNKSGKVKSLLVLAIKLAVFQVDAGVKAETRTNSDPHSTL